MPNRHLAVPWPLSLLVGPAPLLSPDGPRQELPTFGPLLSRQHGDERVTMPYRPLPAAPARLQVLIVGQDAAARAALRQQLLDQLPRAELVEVQGFADAVMQLARGGVNLVLMDLAHLGPLSAGAPLLLRGLAPGARLLGMGPATKQLGSGVEHVEDLAELARWLRRADGR